jgi:hypothetical protein
VILEEEPPVNLPFERVRPRLVLVGLVLLASLAAGCKTPRTPHRVTENDVSGVWRAQSSEPVPIGWSLRLEQGDAGKIQGSGNLTRTDGTSSFTLRGLRGPREINLDFHLEQAAGKFDGSVMSAEMIVGRLFLNGDTINLTFERD